MWEMEQSGMRPRFWLSLAEHPRSGSGEREGGEGEEWKEEVCKCV